MGKTGNKEYFLDRCVLIGIIFIEISNGVAALAHIRFIESRIGELDETKMSIIHNKRVRVICYLSKTRGFSKTMTR